GYYPIDNVFGEQGGGDWGDLGISGPGIQGTVALGDTDNGSPPVYSLKFAGDDTDEDTIPDAVERFHFPDLPAGEQLDQLSKDGDFD
ncbi:MAG: hypothetical protein GWO24_05475, partial [Akkermansiaceae bacterium]|nr:hypothetical protein [Akkermansiaceae bacterium]